MSHISDLEPSTYDEYFKQKEWKDVVVEEYETIIKNDVWEVVPKHWMEVHSKIPYGFIKSSLLLMTILKCIKVRFISWKKA